MGPDVRDIGFGDLESWLAMVGGDSRWLPRLASTGGSRWLTLALAGGDFDLFVAAGVTAADDDLSFGDLEVVGE